LPIMIEANRIWRGLAERTGEADLKFTQCGCVYLAADRAGAEKYENWRELGARYQLDTRMLSRRRLMCACPA